MMLFVWLMSLGVGIANACLLQQDQGSRDYFTSGIDLTALPERHAEPKHFATRAVLSEENTSSPEKVTCLHFCAAEQSTLVSDHLVGLVHLDLVPVLFLTGLLVPATDQTSSPQAFANPAWSEPPVSIRYLRLTI
ncbi:hypothetical protein [Rhodoferax sp.]|uniref:hypothetical protein n=1 Tax=Rhodoferax sp. TaxID=50421 RepID=UPI0025DC863F|nr:hypothetical protein [Rhodoferax sp.]